VITLSSSLLDLMAHDVGTCQIPELAKWLELVGLSHRLEDTCRWCDENGAVFIEEVAEHVVEIAEALNLTEKESRLATMRARPALKSVLPATAPTSPAAEATDVAHEEACAHVQSLRTLSLAKVNNSGSSESRISSKLSAPLEADENIGQGCGGSSNLGRTMSITATFNVSSAAQHFKKSLSFAHHEHVGTNEAGTCGKGMARTCTVDINGPRTAGILAHMPIAEGPLAIAAVSRAFAHTNLTEEEGLPERTPMTQEAWSHAQKIKDQADFRMPPRTRTNSRLRRGDTVTGVVSTEGSRREKLVEEISTDTVHEVPIDAGQTGNVYALEVGGRKIAVFKPIEGEQFHRKSLNAGHGAIREEAVYLVDRLAGSQAGVPVTSRATITVDSEAVAGSVQAFVEDVIGFIEDFAMPRSLERACEFVSQEAAEALAVLDMRVFNMDRHTGNLLLMRSGKPHGLGPIDHGCCLPCWWQLSEANFDAWLSWPQLQGPPCEATRVLVNAANDRLIDTRRMLEDNGLEATAILTLRLCTLFVFVGVAELGLPCANLAHLMLRDEKTGFQELSWLENHILSAAVAAGFGCHVNKDDYGDKELVVDNHGDGLNATAFLDHLKAAFHGELPSAIASASQM